MVRLPAAALVLALAGCLAHVTPYGTYIEPLADVVVVGPPVVVAPPAQVVIQPLPPVYVVPNRSVYYYGSSYYYYWGSNWYWGRDRKGPWHHLDRKFWPSHVEPRGGHGNHGGGKGGHGHH